MLEISEERMADHFTKWHVGGLPFSAVFHRFTQPDHGHPHSHPWNFTSFILSGGYVEEVFNRDGSSKTFFCEAGSSHRVPADCIHRIIDLPQGECWTLILPEPGPTRTPGFYEWRDGVCWHRFWHEREFTRLDMREAAE